MGDVRPAAPADLLDLRVAGTTHVVSGVTVVVVSFNTLEALRRCLSNLEEADEVIVVDNASSDGSAEMVATEFPGIVLIRNSDNRGFGVACNQGMVAAKHQYVLFLNSDAVATQRAINGLASVMDSDTGIVACGGRLEFPDGQLQESCSSSLTLWALFCEQTWLEKLLPRSPVFSPYWMSSRLLRSATKPHYDVEQVMGACLMTRPVEKFDERFFLYCEDTELCKRLRSHGRIVWVPSSVFIHELGASSQERWKAVARYNRGKELYFLIHHGRTASATAFVMNRLGALLRLAAWGAASVLTLFTVQSFRQKAGMFARVLCMPYRDR